MVANSSTTAIGTSAFGGGYSSGMYANLPAPIIAPTLLVVPSATSIGTAGFGSSFPAATISGSLTPVTPVPGTGPTLSVQSTWTSPDFDLNLPMKSMRFVFTRSDDFSVIFEDTGWLPANVANGATFTYGINCISANIPTDTGSGSIDPTLHIAVQIFGSVTPNPQTTGIWTSARSAAFDIQWGLCTLEWASEPPRFITTATASTAWVFTSTRGLPQALWEVTLTSPDGLTLYYDSSESPGTTHSLAIPYALVRNRSYRLVIEASNLNGVPADPLDTIFISGSPPIPFAPILGGPLQRFLTMLSFQLDVNRSLVEQLRNASNPLLCPGSLLPALAQQFGLNYEAEMGMSQTRKLLSNIVHEYKNKGTYVGVEGICEDVTGWNSTAAVSANLMLSSTQVATIDSGVPASTLNDAYIGSSGGPVVPVGYTGPFPNLWPPGFNSILAASAWFSSSAASYDDLDWSSLLGKTPDQWGAPVPQGSSAVSAGVWIWLGGLTGNLLFDVNVSFWNSSGLSLGEFGGAAHVVSQGAWYQLTVQNLTIPKGTAWVSFNVNGSSLSFGANSGIVILAAPQISVGSSLPLYELPRKLDITVDADRVNLVKNSGFESGTTVGWSVLTNCTISAVPGSAYTGPPKPLSQPVVPLWPNPGNHSLGITSIAPGPMSVQSDPMPVDLALLYTGSAYANPLNNPAQQVRMDLICVGTETFPVAGPTPAPNTPSTGAGAVSTVTGSPVETTGMTYSGVAIPEYTSGWVRPFATVDPTSPLPTWATQVAIRITWLNTAAAGETHLIDAVLFERGWSAPTAGLLPYFDGGIWRGDSTDTDYFWADNTNQLGPSFYYRNYVRKITRLYAVLNGSDVNVLGQTSPFALTGFLPVGTVFSLVAPQTV